MSDESIYQEAVKLLNDFRIRLPLLDDHTLNSFAKKAVSLYFDYFQLSKNSLRPAIELICEISNQEDEKTAAIGTKALFVDIIEYLSDSFNPDYCDLYDKLFAQVISFFRELPEGAELNQLLAQLGIHNELDLLLRKHLISQSYLQHQPHNDVNKILIFSRVTIGADIAISSVIIACLSQLFPNSEIVFIGSNKLEQLFGGHRQVRFRSVNYQRGGTVINRLQTWLEVQSIIADETANLALSQFYVIDPDSRLTQLGLLPVLPSFYENHSYLYFPSRSYQPHSNLTIGKLASFWITELMKNNNEFHPFISLPSAIKQNGLLLTNKLRSLGAQKVTCVSFGVGGNNLKRISTEFEARLLKSLLQGSTVILDCGTTPEEIAQVKEIISLIQLPPNSISNFLESTPLLIHQLSALPSLITANGGIGFLSSIIANCDHYVGYDSAGQHIAAALKVPSTTLFVSSGSEKFNARWHPFGTGPINVINTQPYQQTSQITLINDVLRDVLTQSSN